MTIAQAMYILKTYKLPLTPFEMTRFKQALELVKKRTFNQSGV